MGEDVLGVGQAVEQLVERAAFADHAWLERSHFRGPVRMDKATFQGDAWFGEAHFGGPASFVGTQFAGHAWFAGCAFYAPADLSEAVFRRSVGFRGAVVGAINLNGTTFLGPARVSRKAETWNVTAPVCLFISPYVKRWPLPFGCAAGENRETRTGR